MMATYGNQLNNDKVGYVDIPKTNDKDESKAKKWFILRMFSQITKFNFRFNKRALSVLVLVFIFCGVVWWLDDDDDDSVYKRAVGVYIVEENHEVLQYWFSQAAAGKIAKSGNTLIHMDAHSDMAPPKMTEQFPFFTFPKNELQVFEMMQASEVFVSAAASTGLIDHFVWIYPPTNEHLSMKKETFMWNIGHVKNSKTVCECMSPYDNDGVLMVEKGRCGTLSDTDEEVDVDRAACEFRRSVVATFIPGHLALEELELGTLVPHNKDVLLDIDQCYFGFERGLKVLEDAGITSDESKNIQFKVKKMICAKHLAHEQAADRLLKNYIVGIIRACKLSTPDKVCQVDNTELQKTLNPIIENAFKKDPFMFCGKGIPQNLRNAHELLGILRFMNIHKLHALIQLGFCLRSSPVSADFNPYKKTPHNFGLCFGQNTPNITGMGLNTPSDTDLEERMAAFYSMMDEIVKLDVNMVSVVRSVRDGFTPRQLASTIEHEILGYFRMDSALTNIDFYEHYDRNLLGGFRGWQGRYLHKPKLLK